MFKKILLFLVLGTIIGLLLINALEENFDKHNWKQDPLHRYEMSKDIVESRLLIGKNKEEVLELLGMSDSSTYKGKPHLLYKLGKPPSFFNESELIMVVVFKDSLVDKVLLSEE